MIDLPCFQPYRMITTSCRFLLQTIQHSRANVWNRSSGIHALEFRDLFVQRTDGTTAERISRFISRNDEFCARRQQIGCIKRSSTATSGDFLKTGRQFCKHCVCIRRIDWFNRKIDAHIFHVIMMDRSLATEVPTAA